MKLWDKACISEKLPDQNEEAINIRIDYQTHKAYTLPLTSETHVSAGLDALCGNVLLIGIDELIEEGLLPKCDKPKKQPVEAAAFVKVCAALKHL